MARRATRKGRECGAQVRAPTRHQIARHGDEIRLEAVHCIDDRVDGTSA